MGLKTLLKCALPVSLLLGPWGPQTKMLGENLFKTGLILFDSFDRRTRPKLYISDRNVRTKV